MAATILLVDDSRSIRDAIGYILRHSGHAVVEATSGAEALAHLRGGVKPNLILTDLNMEAMTGIEFIRQARAWPAARFTPILVLTVESRRELRHEAKSAGATGWLVKPVEAGALKRIVGQLVECSTCREAAAGGACSPQSQVDFAVGTSATCAAAVGQSPMTRTA